MSSRFKRNSKAFTLVELIVVIGIIALLIAILLPSLRIARQRALQVQCLAKLSGISQAAQIHVLDHHGYLPAAGHHWNLVGDELDPKGLGDELATHYTYYEDEGIKRPVPITVALALAMGLKIHTDSRQALAQDLQREDLRERFHCPAQEVVLRGLSQIGPGWISPHEYSSYVFNEALMGRREYQPNRSDPILGNVAKVKHPSQVFLAADGRPRGNVDGEVILIPNASDHETLSSFVELTVWGPEAARGHLDYVRHGYRMNIVYLDGHAETIYMTDDNLRNVGVSQGIYD